MALKTASQLRAVPGAAMGLDLAACLRLGIALGYDETALAELLPAVETGLIDGLNSRLAVPRPETSSDH